jgi:hypothetical protein
MLYNRIVPGGAPSIRFSSTGFISASLVSLRGCKERTIESFQGLFAAIGDGIVSEDRVGLRGCGGRLREEQGCRSRINPRFLPTTTRIRLGALRVRSVMASTPEAISGGDPGQPHDGRLARAPPAGTSRRLHRERISVRLTDFELFGPAREYPDPQELAAGVCGQERTGSGKPTSHLCYPIGCIKTRLREDKEFYPSNGTGG